MSGDAPNKTSNYVGRNWRFLSDNLSAAMRQLQFDAKRELTPKAKLVGARKCVRAVLAKMQSGRITRLGQQNVRKELGWLVNSINGTLNGLTEQALTKEQLAPLLVRMQGKLQSVTAEIAIKAQKEDEHNAAQEGADTNEDVDQFNGVLALEAAAAASAPTGGYWEGRDQSMVQRLRAIAVKDAAAIKKAIQQAGVLDSDEPKMAFVRAAVVLSTKPQLQEKNLKGANIRYETVRFSGVKYGGNAFEGRGKNEYVPSMFALEDQVLVVVAARPVLAKKPLGNTRMPQAPAKGPPPKPSARKISDALTSMRNDAKAILEMKTGHKYLDILVESKSPMQALVSTAFPGVKFIWLLREAAYNRMSGGGFVLQQAGLLVGSKDIEDAGGPPQPTPEPKPAPKPPKTPEQLKQQKKGATQKTLWPAEREERKQARVGEQTQIPFEEQYVSVADLPPGTGTVQADQALIAIDVDLRGDDKGLKFKYYVFRPSDRRGYVKRVFRSAKPEPALRYCRQKKWKVVKLY